MTPRDLEGIPDGARVRLTLEGRLEGMTNYVYIAGGSKPSDVYTLVFYKRASGLLNMATAIEVLPEPPAEPTKRLALAADQDGNPWVRDDEGLWWCGVHWGGHTWSALTTLYGPLTVLFEGLMGPPQAVPRPREEAP